MSLQTKAIIVGAGPVGCYAAARLCQSHLISEVHVYEKHDSIDPLRSAGRNVNVTLCKRGLEALKVINLIPETEVLPAKKLTHFTIFTGQRKFRQPYYGDGLMSVKRNDLYQALHDKALSFGARFHFSVQFDSIMSSKEEGGNGVAAVFVNKDGHCYTEKCSFLIGSDGVHSSVRKNVFDNIVTSRYTNGNSLTEVVEKYPISCVVQEHLFAYREITVPKQVIETTGFLELDTFHIWGDSGMIVLGLPSADETLTLGVYMDKNELRQLDTARLIGRITEFFPGLDDLLSKIEIQQEESHGFGSLYSIMSPYLGENLTVLLGDAGHGMLPFLGQGLNSGLEDVCLLMDCLNKQQGGNKTFIAKGIQDFSSSRVEDIHTIVHQSFSECEKLQTLGQKSDIADGTEAPPRQSESFFELISTTNIGYKEALDKTSTEKSKGIGVIVKKGETLAVYQAVKTLMTVTSPCDGIVSDVRISPSGQPVYTVKPKSEPVYTSKSDGDTQSSTTRDSVGKPRDSSPQVSIDQFDVAAFKSLLKTKYIGQQFTYLESTGSTMDDAKSAAQQGCTSGSAFMAETMTKGRGRQGKVWTAPPKGNIYITFVLHLQEKSSCVVQFAAALAVAKAVRSEGLDAKVKWPNDIWIRGHKVSGILVEAETVATVNIPNSDKGNNRGDSLVCSYQTDDSAETKAAIFYLGIGINVNDDTRRNSDLRNMATSVSCELFGKNISRERVLANLCLELESALDNDMAAILTELETYLLLKRSSKVKVSPKEEPEFIASVQKIDEQGRLHVRKSETEEEVFVSDLSTSVRPSPHQCIYVYEGDGSSKQSVDMLYQSLLAMCDVSIYSVKIITPEEIRQGSWVNTAAVLAIGGGFDTGYLCALGTDGLKIIKDYIEGGGRYLGICAGAYLACCEIEFDKGGELEVCGSRSLQFFPGKCVGPTFPGFVYNSEAGSRAAHVKWTSQASETEPETSWTGYVYYNGGGHFELDSAADENVETIAKLLNAPDDEIYTVAVKCKVGKGTALLSSVHFEYLHEDLDKNDQFLSQVVPLLQETVNARDRFYMSVLQMLGLYSK